MVIPKSILELYQLIAAELFALRPGRCADSACNGRTGKSGVDQVVEAGATLVSQ